MRPPPADARSARARGDYTLDIARFANPFVVPLAFAYQYILKNEVLFDFGTFQKQEDYSTKLCRGNGDNRAIRQLVKYRPVVISYSFPALGIIRHQNKPKFLADELR
jgi:hypothetical protein